MSAITRALRTAWKRSGLSLDELSKRSRLHLTGASMSRKLNGKQPICADEVIALAGVLGLSAAVTRERIELTAKVPA